MKYSILIPYNKRPTFEETLKSYEKFYINRKTDYEVIVIESKRNREDPIHHKTLDDLINKFKSNVPLRLIQNDDCLYNPAHAYNLGFLNAFGEFIILTNPESPHTVDVYY